MPDYDIKPLAEWLASHQTVQRIPVVNPNVFDSGLPVQSFDVLATVGADGQIGLQVPADLFERFRLYPRAYAGWAVVQDTASFAAHVNRFKDAESAIWCKIDPKEPVLMAVLDYHESKAPPAPPAADALVSTAPASVPHARNLKHRTIYRFPLSAEWLAWNAANKSMMSQADFAIFLEDRILDVIDRAPDTLSERMAAMADILGGNFASPAKLVELSRGMAVAQNQNLKAAVNLSSGESTVSFEATNVDSAGAPLKVPNLFLIAIPVCRNGPSYILPVRLRYRVREGRLVWWYEISYLTETFDQAIMDTAKAAADATSLPVFFGSPEVIGKERE